ncbi:MAG: tetraacyldisaccharide 4'-kinase [Omnitrophica bacterium RIFCSPLOWO2_12_FULL_44_17]|uniref:Tetraacyldisaccharide 4'-kinase n=1 Tax=Candidatus Danuiimicrobium aquiferis TaxID=1801832 RepID=A0A1G1L212_9BACT|nr:MAG: tetraacyldisaccharide 4'-kinase [Omnitrophica bacterium RIFCSPHIGHO2_02_FULL_45_28]OGW88779.1 MAG: tetraacyldisaccharide 4'-kinase [Omnitrophica bacterium RIFCSPHIGHO2_12_FULL_44_12]OGW99164.1 MAG: tetraacyldisaccharide 4'-kinase [Omnitrophica bacterium RIFCSPLOWO2_12_FULL_44_17]
MAENRPTSGGVFCFLLKSIFNFASFFYGKGVQIHRLLYQKNIFKTESFEKTVISIGNLTWGGTGKTPMVEYIANYFITREKIPMILARGYGKDESKELANKLPAAQLGIGSDRVAVAKKILSKSSIDMILLDDGFQHWRIKRDFDIVLINALNPFGNLSILPRGILREPMSSLSRASFIILTDTNLVPRKETDFLKEKIRTFNPPVEFAEACHEPVCFYRADSPHKQIPLDQLEGKRMTVFSGIGMPRSFQMILNRIGVKSVRNFEFDDHHMFLSRELEDIRKEKSLSRSEGSITTEKDYFRCPGRITQILNPYILKIHMRLISGEEEFQTRLDSFFEEGSHG